MAEIHNVVVVQFPDASKAYQARVTGLEPATSGVTGRYGLDRYSRLRPGITG